MAYKEESDQQFIESIVRQASRPGQPFNRPGFQNLDNPDPENINPLHVRGDHPAWDTVTGNRDRYQAAMREKASQQKNPAMSTFHLKQQYPDVGLGGYSSDTGRHSAAPEANVNNIDDHFNMRQIKKQIEEKEKELHELQQRKVELMRKITGRL